MIQDLLKTFLSENFLKFILTAVFITAILHQLFPLNAVSSARFYMKKPLILYTAIQFLFGLIIAYCLTLLNIITPLGTFHGKKLLLRECHELPGCIVERGIAYIPNVQIRYSNDRDFFKLTYKYHDTKPNKNRTYQTYLNRSYILGLETND